MLAEIIAGSHSDEFQTPVALPVSCPIRTIVVRIEVRSPAARTSSSAIHFASLYPCPTALAAFKGCSGGGSRSAE